MKNLKVLFKSMCVSVLAFGLASCGGDDDGKKKAASYPTKTYVCESQRESATVNILLEQDPTFEDELARVEITSPGLKIELNLLLGIRYRSTYEFRQALAYKNGINTGNRADLVVASDPFSAPEVMILDLYGSGTASQLQIVSNSLKQALRGSLVYGEAVPRRRPNKRRKYNDERDERPFERGEDSSAMVMNCTKL